MEEKKKPNFLDYLAVPGFIIILILSLRLIYKIFF